MGHMQETDRRGRSRQAIPRRSFYPQRGMESPILRSTGRYRGDTGSPADLYLIRPRGNALLDKGMTLLDLMVVLVAVALIAVSAYALGPGMDGCMDALGW